MLTIRLKEVDALARLADTSQAEVALKGVGGALGGAAKGAVMPFPTRVPPRPACPGASGACSAAWARRPGTAERARKQSRTTSLRQPGRAGIQVDGGGRPRTRPATPPRASSASARGRRRWAKRAGRRPLHEQCRPGRGPGQGGADRRRRPLRHQAGAGRERPLHGRERQRPRLREEPGRAPEVQRRSTSRRWARRAAQIKALRGNKNIRLGVETRIVAALDALSGVADRSAFLSRAAAVDSEAGALYYATSAEMLARFHAASPLTRLVPAQGAALALTKDGRLVHLVPADYIPWTQPVAQAVGVAVQRAKEDFASAGSGGLDHGRRQRAHEQGASRARLEDRGAEAGAGERAREIGRQVMERTIGGRRPARTPPLPAPRARPAGRGLRRGERPPGRPRCRARPGSWTACARPRGCATTVDPSRYTIEFQEAFRVRAQADCNVCTGSYRTATSIQLTIGPLACTRAFCAVGQPGRRIRRAPEHHEALRPGGRHPGPVLRRRHAALPAVKGGASTAGDQPARRRLLLLGASGREVLEELVAGLRQLLGVLLGLVRELVRRRAAPDERLWTWRRTCRSPACPPCTRGRSSGSNRPCHPTGIRHIRRCRTCRGSSSCRWPRGAPRSRPPCPRERPAIPSP